MIPVRNLYAMLAFASYDGGRLDDRVIDACDFERPFEILGRLLDATMKRLRQQGIDREFQERFEHGTHPRGALDLSRSISMLLPPRGQIAWRVDELVADTANNRLLKCAIRVLLLRSELPLELRYRLRTHVQWLSAVRDVDAHAALRVASRAPAGIPAYREGIQLARLTLEQGLPDEGDSGTAWRALAERPERMETLFERFVRGFARYEFRADAQVTAKRMRWQEQSADARGVEMLPEMKTDVFIDWKDSEPTIVECKYYDKVLSKSLYSNWGRLRSSHIYQVLAYLRAAERHIGGSGRGLLLYAWNGEQVSVDVKLEGYPVRAVCISLDLEWEILQGRLRSILLSGMADLETQC